MSTYLYLECRSHEPPLRSDDEVGQHLSDLPRIRREITDRDAFVATSRANDFVNYGDPWTNTAARFFREHPQCTIGIIDEYKRDHPIEEQSAS